MKRASWTLPFLKRQYTNKCSCYWDAPILAKQTVFLKCFLHFLSPSTVSREHDYHLHCKWEIAIWFKDDFSYCMFQEGVYMFQLLWGNTSTAFLTLNLEIIQHYNFAFTKICPHLQSICNITQWFTYKYVFFAVVHLYISC